MLINETTNNCCKPKRFTTFTGAESSKFKERKVQAKHYHQMSDEVLQLRSVLKAHKEVQESGKMQLFKAMPAITTGLIGTTIAITQPGKLATKAAAGLGFLALSEAVKFGAEKVLNGVEKHKKENNGFNPKKIIQTTAKVALGLGVVAGSLAIAKNTKGFNKASEFLSKEAGQLAKEINETKLGKFVEQVANPFVKKHAKTFKVVEAVAPYGLIFGSAVACSKLSDSLSNDVKIKSTQNYLKGKMIQAQARAHYDSIDAQEMK